MQNKRVYRGGFALPTVLITSVVMLTILAVSVTSVAAIRTGLKTQYYEQLAKEAGEAGVAYARACLSKNGNVPLWTNSKPLKPSTDCSGTAIVGLNCPGDAGCSVVVNDTVRSSFSVPAPTVNTQGKAVTIPNSGYVDLIRGSNGQVWRTYNQPAVQAAVVPDLCSGSATAGLGWSNAAASSGANISTIAEVPSAITISLSDATLPAGQIYFRKDFTVSTADTYKVSALTNSSKDKVEIYIDGTNITTSQGTLSSSSTALSAGCHTITARLTNKTIVPAYSQFTAAVNVSGGATPVVSTDTSWRVSSGSATSFSTSDFYADTDVWKPVTTYGSPLAQVSNASWSGGGDAFTAMIAPSGNGCPTACPFASTAYLRDSKDFYLAADTYVTASLLCDDFCKLYIDGQPVLETTWSDIARQSFTLTKGYHHAGIQLYNGAAAANASGAGMSIVTGGGGTVYSRTDTSWIATTNWQSGAGTNVIAYESTFNPSPKEIIDPVAADILVVAGGGAGGGNGGGGGGGGGVRYIQGLPLEVKTYTVTVGAAGTAYASNTTVGGSGGASIFGSYTSVGGGGGASRDGGAAATSGGSGGGGAGATVAARNPGAAGMSGQGNAGGSGVAADAGANATGGGGGGAGSMGANGVAAGSAGAGGAGIIYYIDGTRLAVGGGGGAGVTANGIVGIATDNGGVGALVGGNAGGGTTNTGGGGGGGGGAGGGGSGVVIIRIKTGSATVAPGAYTTSTVTIRGVSYTVYKFTSSGSFVITALNPS